MSHYEERLQHDLDAIQARISAVAETIDRAIADAAQALLARDRELAARVVLGDLPINREIREIDRLCHVFVARHLPSAGVLRTISSVLQLSVALERVGDYGVTIAREAVQLTTDPPDTVARDIEMMADQSRRVFRQAMKAWREGNAELARGTKGLTSQARDTFGKVFFDLLREGEGGGHALRDLFALLIVLNRLERVGDQAKNICEETIFAHTGETKRPKVYNVLFVDGPNEFASVMAESIARRAYPESGKYASAGWEPAARFDAAALDFLDRSGLKISRSQPTQLPAGYRDLDDYHVIVGVGADPFDHLPEIPFHTVVLHWGLQLPERPATGFTDEQLEVLQRELTVHVRALVETLRGNDAN